MNNDELKRRAEMALANFVNRKPKVPPWENRKIVIYGAGSFGRDLAKALLRQRNIDILGFLDQKGTGQTVCHDLRAYNLEASMAKKWLAEKPIVMIGVFNFSASLREIKETLLVLGFSPVLTPMEFYADLHEELGWRYWLARGQDYTEAAEPLRKVFELWADEESKRLFLETLLFRLDANLASLSTISSAESQYADATVPRWKEPLRMVDGGAYLGDAIRCVDSQGYTFDSIYSFEPDEGNFKQLRAGLASIVGSAKMSLWPCGLWSSSGQLRFSQGGGAASKLSETGTSQVPVVALDDVLFHQQINLIKLDIEGAELEALSGARRMIEKDRPGLAVCLYHYPDHLWSIPLWVESLQFGYRMYYRAHQQNSFDTILYAIPK